MRRLILAATLSSAAVGAGAADQGGIVLTITSSAPGTAFSAVCTLFEDGARTTEDHSGRAPATLRFDAEGLHCELSSEGPLRVLAEGPRGNRSLTSTSGGRIVVSLSF